MANQRDHVPRPRYPSDDARLRVKPHVRVHLSVRGHPKTAAVWADAEQRGMLTELWRLASERGAAHTGDWLALSRHDVGFVTDRQKPEAAWLALWRLLRSLDWAFHQAGTGPTPGWHQLDTGPTRGDQRPPYKPGVVLVHVRNFAKKQGLAPQHGGAISASSATSPTTTTEVRGGSDKDSAPPRPDAAVAAPGPAAPQLQLLRPEVSADEVVAAWRAVCVPKGAPDVREVTNSRLAKLRQRIREHPTLAWWTELFGKLARTPFLFGSGGRGWRADLDWLVANDKNALRVLEGKYDDQAQGTGAGRYRGGR